MRSVDENKAALLELGSSPAMRRMLETMAPPIRRIRAVADSLVLDPRNRQPHVEHADHRGVERLGLHLEQQRHGSLYGSPIPNRAACLPVQRSQIRNACGVRRARWGPRPSTCGRTYPAPVDPAYANRQQHGPTTQHPNRACPVSYSTMGPDIVVPTIGTGTTWCIGQFWFRVVPKSSYRTLHPSCAKRFKPFIRPQQRPKGVSPLAPFSRPSTLVVFQGHFLAHLLKWINHIRTCLCEPRLAAYQNQQIVSLCLSYLLIIVRISKPFAPAKPRKVLRWSKS